MKAWHFHNGSTLRDGRPLPKVGETIVHDGEPILCVQGLHASIRPLDALRYAPGAWVDRVEVGGTVVHGDDKLVATERTTLWRLDATDVLRRFVRRCALDVAHLWDAPEVVVKYLKTGDTSLRVAAEKAVGDAAQDAERVAAWDAAQASVRATCYTDDHTVFAAGARYAAWAAAWAAARDAARASVRATCDTDVHTVFRDAALDAQNRRLYRLLNAAKGVACAS